MGARHLPEAQALSFEEEQALLGCPTKRAKKLAEAARPPAEICDYMDSGRGLNFLEQSDLRLPCVSAGLNCWGVSCDSI